MAGVDGIELDGARRTLVAEVERQRAERRELPKNVGPYQLGDEIGRGEPRVQVAALRS